jgi:hypothetical protein
MSDMNDGSLEAATLAEKVVVCEARLQALRNLKAPVIIIDQAVRVLANYTERLMKSSAAESLLAQARIVVEARARRRRYILEKTLLGKLCGPKLGPGFRQGWIRPCLMSV